MSRTHHHESRRWTPEEILQANAARMAVLDARMAEANGGHIPWLAGTGEQADGSHICTTPDCIRVPRVGVAS